MSEWQRLEAQIAVLEQSAVGNQAAQDILIQARLELERGATFETNLLLMRAELLIFQGLRGR